MKYLILLLLAFNVQAQNLSQLISIEEPAIIADKSSGKIYVYSPLDRKVISSNALYGKIISDDLDLSKQITPAGTYISHKYFSSHLNEHITAFIEGTKSFIAIHPVWLANPNQKRQERLDSESGIDNRITNGCINVPIAFYTDVMEKLKNGIKVIVLKEGEVLFDDMTNNPTYTTPIVTTKLTESPIAVQYTPEVAKDFAGNAGDAGNPGLN